MTATVIQEMTTMATQVMTTTVSQVMTFDPLTWRTLSSCAPRLCISSSYKWCCWYAALLVCSRDSAWSINSSAFCFTVDSSSDNNSLTYNNNTGSYNTCPHSLTYNNTGSYNTCPHSLTYNNNTGSYNTCLLTQLQQQHRQLQHMSAHTTTTHL